MRQWGRRRWRLVLGLLAVLWAASALWQAYKPLPAGVGVAWPWRAAPAVSFLADASFITPAGARRSEQQIFDAALAMIAQARRLVVLDAFLFTDLGSGSSTPLRPLSRELTQALAERLRTVPELRVIVIVDPVNTLYGGMRASHLEALRAGGAEVVPVDLAALRASNPAWSGLWALCCAWLGNAADGGWLVNPLGGAPVTLRSWLELPNFRANHRKVLVVDHGAGWRALVTSANPHDASSAHDNVALRFGGAAALDLVASEAAVAAFSGVPLTALPRPAAPAPMPAAPRLRVLGEGAIRAAVLDSIAATGAGEQLDLALFYLADRGVIAALRAAQARGARLRVLLDPNEDAFGRKKSGVPNRPVAAELVAAGIPVRWCDTHGEQCHAKFLLRRGGDMDELIIGSANYTRRNLADLNLETSVQFAAPTEHAAMRDAATWFEMVWGNAPGRRLSVDYARYAEDPILKRIWYRFGEATGWSTW